MKEILFICQGNVGRSQMAEGFYNRIRGEEAAISAGTQDVAAKYGGHPTQEIIQVMREKGIDVSSQKIKQVNEGMLADVGMVVILCDPKHCPAWIFNSNVKIIVAQIEDPYEANVDRTKQIRDQIESLVLRLILEGLNNETEKEK